MYWASVLGQVAASIHSQLCYQRASDWILFGGLCAALGFGAGVAVTAFALSPGLRQVLLRLLFFYVSGGAVVPRPIRRPIFLPPG